MTIKIGIVGSRVRNRHEDWLKLMEAFNKLIRDKNLQPSEIRLVSGGCSRGADSWAEDISHDNDIPITIHYADWKSLGRKAGPMRNGLIAKDADILIAVASPNNDGGTEDCINKFKKLKPTAELIIV